MNPQISQIKESFDGRDRQSINALAKKQRRINPAESENSPIDRAAVFDITLR